MRATPTVTVAAHTVYGTASSFTVHSKTNKGVSFRVSASGNGTYYTDGGNYEADAEL